jgi:hypothetical protein
VTLPDYWLERPSASTNGRTRAALEHFLSVVDDESNLPVDLDALLRRHGDIEPWEFLCRVADRRRIAFHGTGEAGIESFEPRRPIDFAPFGDQKAVFATSDPIWAMFYAIVDRDRVTLNNGCIIVTDSDGRPGPPHYYFSVSQDALPQRPWRPGYVYLLPAQGFVEQPSGPYAGRTARVPQLASPVAVRPFARPQVAPGDFPLLPHIRGDDDERLAEYAEAVMTAARGQSKRPPQHCQNGLLSNTATDGSLRPSTQRGSHA